MEHSETKAHYAQISSFYRSETFGEPITVTSITRDMRTKTALAMLERHLRADDLVADVGCGPGQFAGALLKTGLRYVGVDLTVQMFDDMARTLANDRRAAFAAGQIEQIPFKSQSIDGVVCTGVLEYVPDPWAAVKEIRRILKPGAVAVVSFPNALNPIHAVRSAIRPLAAPLLRKVAPASRSTIFASGIHHRPFNPHSFLKTAGHLGFSVVETFCHGFFFSPFNHKLSSTGAALHSRIEMLGRRLVPWMGLNFIACLRRT